MPSAFRVLDVPIHPLSMADVLNRIAQVIDSRTPQQIVTVNLDFIRLACKDPRFRAVLSEAAVAVADGMPLVWLSRLTGPKLPERIAGIDLVEQTAALAASRGDSVYLLGAATGVADAAAVELVRRNPTLKIAGTYSPPMGEFSAVENRQMVQRIRAAGPDILFVAFGAPRQDLWISDHLDALGVAVCIGVGGSLNFLAGEQVRAPRWMQRSGLEWAHRLLHEPRRLWKRYLLGDLPVLLRIATSHWLHSPRGHAAGD